MNIIPAILSDSLTTIQNQLDRVAEETSLRRVQIDIIDGEYTDNITVTPIDLLDLNLHDFAIDIHLMTNDPINDVIEASQVPGIYTIIAQIERMPSQSAFLEHVKSYGINTGFSLDLYTHPDAIDKESYLAADAIQVMGNRAGVQGELFAGEPVLEKIRSIAALPTLLRRPSFELLVDIGMNPTTVGQCAQAGATHAMVGSFLWESENLAAALEALLITQ